MKNLKVKSFLITFVGFSLVSTVMLVLWYSKIAQIFPLIVLFTVGYFIMTWYFIHQNIKSNLTDLTTKLGCIKITPNTIWFEYHELKEPHLEDFKALQPFPEYEIADKKYKASKRSILVSNIIFGKLSKTWIIKNDLYGFRGREIKNNQPCKAKVNGKAKIIELIK